MALLDHYYGIIIGFILFTPHPSNPDYFLQFYGSLYEDIKKVNLKTALFFKLGWHRFAFPVCVECIRWRMTGAGNKAPVLSGGLRTDYAHSQVDTVAVPHSGTIILCIFSLSWAFVLRELSTMVFIMLI